MTATKQPTLPATDAPDAEWLAQVREDAGRWWSTWEPELPHALCAGRDNAGDWRVWHQASGVCLFRAWPDERSARLWLWVVLGAANWHTGITPDRLTAERRADLAALERRLRTALGLGRAEAA